MSPASSGNLEVERYIGACLISQNRAGKSRNEHIFSHNRDHYIPDIYQQHVNFRLQRCQSVDGWAGGVPLISFANHQRRPKQTEDHQANPLARLAVHTQGAPLILSKSYNHRKNKVHRNTATKVFENSNIKKPNSKCPEQQNSSNNSAGVDTVSVTSDESSGSANSENCLPRIIKPRKRRKKDRKPPLLGRPLSHDGFSTDSASPEIDNGQSGVLTLGSFIPFTFDPFPSYRLSESPRLIDRCHILGDISETPKLHHAFEDIEELDDGKDINGNQATSTCQCRYCDPSGQIWDVDRNCYSPFLTPPTSHTKTFQFPSLAYSSSCPISSDDRLVHSMSTVSLEEEENKKLPPSRSSSSSSCRDLEVSTEIVTSLNGHRDLEIKFFSSPSVDKDAGEAGEISKTNKCAVNITTPTPPPRPWIPLTKPSSDRPTCIFTVMCYNVLCDKLATRQMYSYCPSWALNWEYRKKGILEEIKHYGADIINLQEVEMEQFYNFFLPELKMDGYNGIYSPKSRAKHMAESERKYVDGCAIFYRVSKFTLIREHLVEFNQLAMANADGLEHMLNRVMPKDNIGLAALLQTTPDAWENAPQDAPFFRQPVLVCTAHIHWDPEFCDVKLIQTMMLSNELKSILEQSVETLKSYNLMLEPSNIQLVLCGDFNSLPDSGVIEFLGTGRVSQDHKDFKTFSYKSCLEKILSCDKPNEFTHSFKLASAYNDNIMPFTNYTFEFKGIIDYIFYAKQTMTPLGLLGPLSQEWLQQNKVIGCPHPHVYSDHFPLLVELEMVPTITAAMNVVGHRMLYPQHGYYDANGHFVTPQYPPPPPYRYYRNPY